MSENNSGKLGESLKSVNAVADNYRRAIDVLTPDVNSDEYPPIPSFYPLNSQSAREQMFGKFNYTIVDQSNIRILGDWVNENIVTVKIPQLIGIPGYHTGGNVRVHKLIKDKILLLFSSWEQQKLMSRVVFWGGAFVPRLVRGSQTVLSNHSWGTAFDINTIDNAMGIVPAAIGAAGCLRELVPTANAQGWYWGGHFKRQDGMHFEVSKL